MKGAVSERHGSPDVHEIRGICRIVILVDIQIFAELTVSSFLLTQIAQQIQASLWATAQVALLWPTRSDNPGAGLQRCRSLTHTLASSGA